MEMHLYHCLHTHRYMEAFAVYTEAREHERFAILEGGSQEDWMMFGGYFNLLAILGQLDAKEVEKSVGKFKASKFENDFNLHDKDKEGMNIPRLLLPMLFSIAQKKYDDFSKSREALIKYRQRYLNSETNRRSAIFMGILLNIAELPFEKMQAQRKIEKGLADLQAEPSHYIGQSFAVEIVPYDDLTKLLLDVV
jgi:hypothetical protein